MLQQYISLNKFIMLMICFASLFALHLFFFFMHSSCNSVSNLPSGSLLYILYNVLTLAPNKSAGFNFLMYDIVLIGTFISPKLLLFTLCISVGLFSCFIATHSACQNLQNFLSSTWAKSASYDWIYNGIYCSQSIFQATNVS